MRGLGLCDRCGCALDPLRARHSAVRAGRVVPFCSIACRDGLVPTAPDVPPEAPPTVARATRKSRRPREPWRILTTLGATAAVALLVLAAGAVSRAARPADKLVRAEVVAALSASTRIPTRRATMQRTWVHPLPGNDRRLPDNPTRRFGAFRAHPHPPECRQGHCGIDLSARIGEPVMAVTDGRVERIANDDPDRLGGVYVRIAHPVAGGAIVTWYMHLSRIRRSLALGDTVAAGELIGYAGKSGIDVSEPHLHFAVGLRFPDREVDLFVDPEPLLRRWRMQTGFAGLAVLRQE